VTRGFDPTLLPDEVRASVEGARRDGAEHQAAITALETYLARGGARTPEVLLALATLTYEDAATVVLSRLRAASEQALALVDEALAQDPREDLAALRDRFARSLAHERDRERRLRELLDDPRRARPAELMALAHQILMSGEDDALAAELMQAAAEA